MTGSSDLRWELGHRPALDGLRGWAVLLVLLSHTGLPYTGTAGTVGVNLFFILSGFLITQLLIEEQSRHGGIDLRQFFARRSLRLLPAMALFLPVTAVVGWKYGQPLDQVLYAGFYVANVVRASGNSMPLMPHTWSLAQEEQFYLVWPALLAWWSRRRPVRSLATGVAVFVALTLVGRVVLASSGASLLRLHNDPILAAGILAAGCLLALWSASVMPAVRSMTVPLGGALLALVWLSVLNKSSGYYVWGLTGVMVAGVVLVTALVADEDGPLVAAFRWRGIRALGRISYGLYLWHYTVYFVVKQYVGTQPAKAGLQIGISLVVAIASYHWLERPFLRRKEHHRRDAPADHVGSREPAASTV